MADQSTIRGIVGPFGCKSCGRTIEHTGYCVVCRRKRLDEACSDQVNSMRKEAAALVAKAVKEFQEGRESHLESQLMDNTENSATQRRSYLEMVERILCIPPAERTPFQKGIADNWSREEQRFEEPDIDP